ncbi:tetratricopeptide repeat protein [Catellatospora citrea]|uniref:Tetratricopeptide repeat protein n=1 Tax=Catellatospora citrea TaxID=53366 RepID=A0A8J3P6A5_9ACTN|nr:tetratricopeptide repeat protein [Catellatospora citrea]RKE11390.1 NB-ARC domain-containing protein [Catellatospora citrea]GIG03236.1 tetratricopeptide repeat protein [Catellatospora citrea]
MAERSHDQDSAPRTAFTAALAQLRRRLPDVSDEVLARRASSIALPSGRRIAVNARRLGEWINGRSVPRDFEQVHALVQAVETAVGGPATGQSLQRWRQLWRAAHEQQRTPVRTPPAAGPGAELVVGRPPSDAASLRERPDLAAAIDDALRDEAVRQVLLTGPGGAGKSQLAAAAFHRARGGGGLFAWVSASSRQSLLTGYARVWRAVAGGVLDAAPGARPAHPDGYGHDEETQADLLVAWLRATPQPWLVVLDDADDPADLDGLWPIGEHGRSIVTTRRRDALVLRPSARVVQVGMFTGAESVDYLRNRLSLDPAAGHGEPPPDGELAGLAAALGHFPLALSQAAAFLIDTGTGVATYRRLLDDERERLADLFPPSSPADGHDRTVASTWQLAAQRAAALAKPGTAQRMLELVSLLAPVGVPQELLLTGAARAWIGADRREALPALRALHRLSLITHDAATVAMHALVQRAVRESVPDTELPALARAAADALDEAWAAPDAGLPVAALYDSLLALRRVAGEQLWHEGMHPVLRRLGEHLMAVGRTAAARDTLDELLEQARARLGDGHRDAIFVAAQRAQAVGELGDPAAAHPELTRLRRDAERLLGADDPDTLWIRLREGLQPFELGAPAVALADMVPLLARATAVLGDDHPLTLSARRYVALCQGMCGDPAAARDGFRALAGELARRRGPAHADTVSTLSDLGRWIGEAGDAELAVQTYQRAVEGLVAVHGPLHHDTLTARHNLAYWRGLAGQPAAAVEEFGVATQDAERALGPRHPTTLTFRTNLAYWTGLADDPGAGMAALAALQTVVEEVFGHAHPRALRTRQLHAQLRHRGGDVAGAVGELTAVLADMRAVQSDDHLRTGEAAQLLASWTAPPGATAAAPASA